MTHIKVPMMIVLIVLVLAAVAQIAIGVAVGSVLAKRSAEYPITPNGE